MSVTQVQGTHTPNQGRAIWNQNDVDLESAVAAVASDLSDHASGSDHDGRYYTEAEVDAIAGDLQNAFDALESIVSDKRPRWSVLVLLKSGKNSISMNGVDFSYTNSGFQVDRSGCLTGVLVTNPGAGTKEGLTQAYRSSGSAAQGRFSPGSVINFYRNTTTGINNPTIDGAAVTSANLDNSSVITNVSDNAITLILEFDA